MLNEKEIQNLFDPPELLGKMEKFFNVFIRNKCKTLQCSHEKREEIAKAIIENIRHSIYFHLVVLEKANLSEDIFKVCESYKNLMEALNDSVKTIGTEIETK